MLNNNPAEKETVFISYRRTKYALAQAVKLSLEQANYDVFLDVSNITQGDFLSTLEDRVKQAKHFIPILTLDSVERCINKDDVVRKEIEWALESQRNIVPLMFEGFKFSEAKRYLVDRLKLLSWYAGVNVPEDYFEEAMVRLYTRFLANADQVRHPRGETITEGGSREGQKLDNETDDVKAERLLIRAEQSVSNRYRAIDYLTQAIQLRPKFIEAYYKRACIYFRNHDYSEARADWQKALDIIISSPILSKNLAARKHIILSWLAFADRDYETALQEANYAINVDPLDYENYLRRSAATARLKKYDESIEDCHRAINLNPNSAIAYNARALRYINRPDPFYEEALSDFSMAIQIEPEYSPPHTNRGELYFVRSQYHLAYDEFRQAVKLNPTSIPALGGLAITAYRLGEIYEAKRIWRFIASAENANSSGVSIFLNLNQVNEVIRKLDYNREPLIEAVKEFMQVVVDSA